MEQYISQEEVRRIIISDMVKKRNSIVPVIGEDTIVYKADGTGKEISFWNRNGLSWECNYGSKDFIRSV